MLPQAYREWLKILTANIDTKQHAAWLKLNI